MITNIATLKGWDELEGRIVSVYMWTKMITAPSEIALANQLSQTLGESRRRE